MTVRARAALSVALGLWICVPYFALQRLSSGPAHLMAPSWIDDFVPFDPGWTAVYLSLYVALLVPAFAGGDGPWLGRYALGVFLIASVAHACFLLVPTTVALPPFADDGTLYAFMRVHDRARNANPSLHASLAVFAGLSFRGAPAARVALWAWIAAILYATLATRQHVAMDLVGGAALALLVSFALRERS